jgi:superfamily II DNA helicase RecQ
MQECSSCEDSNRCRLKENAFFEICPKLIAIKKCNEKRQDCTDKSGDPVRKDLNITDTRIDFKTLNKYFGYSKFRPLQNEIILDVLNGKDVLVLMPTLT